MPQRHRALAGPVLPLSAFAREAPDSVAMRNNVPSSQAREARASTGGTSRTRKVLGRRMEEQLRIAVCYWHTLVWTGTDPFGGETFLRPWHRAAAIP